MSVLQIEEKDTTGTVLQSYILTTTRAGDAQPGPITRLDTVPATLKFSTRSTATSSTQSFLKTHVAPLFLPQGYPHSVTPDYTAYQVYDSLQAFSSSIAGLLSSRAVLQSLGMDTEGGTSMATYATLLSIARSTISNLSQILFADYMSSRVSGEVKFYRFLADIMNDAGFLLEMVSPSLPDYLKVPSLCLSSALRAMCGVAGGASKAILSAHFAVDGNIGELNAKDGSQETLVNLVGMWVGGVVVSRVESLWATWCWMIILLTMHLWFNWLAVTSVRLRGLNLGRSSMLFTTLIGEDRCETVECIGRKESVFGKPGIVCSKDGITILTGKVGVGMKEFMRCVGSRKQSGSGSELIRNDTVSAVVVVFSEEQYLLWYTPNGQKAVVLLKEGASRDDQLKSWCHIVRIALRLGEKNKMGTDLLQLISDTLQINNDAWEGFRHRIGDAGWDMNATILESTPGVRVRLVASKQ